ncbi:phosphodiester glycosidase family protein [Sphingomonas astaxanthinifaciens]|nr:phosphodiester glycosidase family protein [Sphingomonas astaxanthinifaciens]
MHFVWLLVLLLAACKKPEPAPETGEGPCRSLMFEGDRFTLCRDPLARLELHVAGRDGRPYRSFAALEHVLGARAPKVRFAMNAGMFDEDGRPIGLAIAGGQEVKAINRREKGGGNFHLQPNGVFLVRSDGRSEIVPSRAFEPSADIALATQSGPMLVIDGAVNARFSPDGTSRFVRNAVGIDPDGVPLFVISDSAVSFGKFARLFRDELKCRNALYLDGSVSSLWDPVNGRMDSFSGLGPMLVAFRD